MQAEWAEKENEIQMKNKRSVDTELETANTEKKRMYSCARVAMKPTDSRQWMPFIGNGLRESKNFEIAFYYYGLCGCVLGAGES